MTVKLDTLADWKKSGGVIGLKGTDHRRVKIYFNCEAQTPLYIKLDGDEHPSFLATLAPGLETLEFWASGTLQIAPLDADAVYLWQSTEDDSMVFEGDGETFTTIHNRAPRNEALEWMQFQAEQNAKAFQAQLRADMEAQIATMRSEYEGTTTGLRSGATAQHPQPKGQSVGGKTPKAVASDDTGGGNELLSEAPGHTSESGVVDGQAGA